MHAVAPSQSDEQFFTDRKGETEIIFEMKIVFCARMREAAHRRSYERACMFVGNTHHDLQLAQLYKSTKRLT
jgi:hypothetical protein